MPTRRKTKYKTIGLPEPDFETLSEIKALYEADTNEKVDWRRFLLTLGLGYLIAKGLAEQTKPRKRRRKTS